MTHWLTIALIVCPALFVVQIGAVGQQSLNPQMTSSLKTEPKSSLIGGKRLTKRASFMPSRGKKENPFDGMAIDDKRASAGFLPMRGRKDSYSDSSAHNWYVGPQMAYRPDVDEKRAGFMPMRGRKSSAYPSDETAGDIYPVELTDIKRSSFMPMRGRKDDFTYDQSFGRTAYAVPQTIRQSTQSMDNTNWMEGEHSLNGRVGAQSGFGGGPELEKKANAFFGSRGKRSAANDHSMGQSSHENHHKYNENFFATRG